MPAKKKTCKATYYPSTNTVHIKAQSSDFIPQYLKYLFEYLKIPQNATIVFTDKTIIGGIEKWLKQ